MNTPTVFVSAVLMAAIISGSAAAGPREETAAWRVKRDAELRAPDGWLSLAGLYFLAPGVNTVGTDPGSDLVLPAGSAPAHAARVLVQAGHVFLEPHAQVSLRLNNNPVTTRVELHESDPPSKRPADRVAIGRVLFQVHRSGERLGLRVMDPESPFLRQFAGLRWYAIDERWRVTGRFRPYDTPITVHALNIAGDLEPWVSPGEVEFSSGGVVFRVQVFRGGERLWMVFSDETATRGETYRFRFLGADAPSADGQVELDFNRAYNPPCAFNPHTTCLFPPPQNRLTIEVPAGEKTYVSKPPTDTR